MFSLRYPSLPFPAQEGQQQQQPTSLLGSSLLLRYVFVPPSALCCCFPMLKRLIGVSAIPLFHFAYTIFVTASHDPPRRGESIITTDSQKPNGSFEWLGVLHTSYTSIIHPSRPQDDFIPLVFNLLTTYCTLQTYFYIICRRLCSFHLNRSEE